VSRLSAAQLSLHSRFNILHVITCTPGTSLHMFFDKGLPVIGIQVFFLLDLGQTFFAGDNAVVFFTPVLGRYFIHFQSICGATEFAFVVTALKQLYFQ
jgi:hypothetical protein